MGRITQTFIKRTGDSLIVKYPKRFKENFEENKKSLQDLIDNGELDCPSKLVRNKLAGYMVKGVKPKSTLKPRPPKTTPDKRFAPRKFRRY